ncbi:MAG: transposase [Caulobacteraceae bacterium]|nr:MAG: transposase [Caulobacteraceae bacterium]
MARRPRVVVPGLPHHVTQRGNRRQPIFFEDGDQRVYKFMLAEHCRRWGVEIWAYCLMPNHVHLIMTPGDETGLAKVMGETHRRYTSFINSRHGWVGHLFQGRYASVVMDERHLLAAARYVGLNPVRAKLVDRAEAWPWSSVRAHIAGEDDGLVRVRPMLQRIERFAEFMHPEPAGETAWEEAYRALRASETTGRPCGAETFVRRLEAELGRALLPERRGRPKNRGQVIRSPVATSDEHWGADNLSPI